MLGADLSSSILSYRAILPEMGGCALRSGCTDGAPCDVEDEGELMDLEALDVERSVAVTKFEVLRSYGCVVEG